MPVDLSQLQKESRVWRDRNFPDHSSIDAFLGMTEEMGELAHAILKRAQGIRGTADEHTAAIRDAVADWIIFACGFADNEGFDIGEVVQQTWEQVKMRDWLADPRNGGAAG